MRARSAFLFFACLLGFPAASLHAEEVLMARAQEGFPEAMQRLQERIGDQGYTVSRVQRVDIGLTRSGYQTDKYRVVFFGKPQEVARLTAQQPELIPYLPLKVAIFAEGEDTLVVASDPELWVRFFGDPELADIFTGWSRDLHVIFDAMRTGD